MREKHREQPENAAEQEQPADIDIDGDRRDTGPNYGKDTQDCHDHALGQEQSPMIAHRISNGNLHVAERRI